MTWFPFALAAPALWGASNMVDARLLKREVPDALALVIITGLFGGIPAIVVAAMGAFDAVSGGAVVLAIAAGVVGLLVYFPYLRALEVASPASVILMWNLAPVFIVGIAWFALGERLLPSEYVAVVLLVASTLTAARHRGSETAWSRGLPWMVLASLLIAVEAVLQKALFEHAAFAPGLAWMSAATCGTAIVLIPLRASTRRALRGALDWRTVAVLTANEGLDVGAGAALSRATSLGPVTLVHAVGGLQPLFILVFAAITAQRSERPTARGELARHAVAIALAVAGLGLIRSLEQ